MILIKLEYDMTAGNNNSNKTKPKMSLQIQ